MSDYAGFHNPARTTAFWCNLPNDVLGRHPWTLHRGAKDIRQQRQIYERFGGLFSSGGTLFTGDAWILQPFGHDPVEMLTTAGDFHVTAAQVNLASNHRAFNTYRQTSVLGAGQSADLIAAGMPAFQRRRIASASLDTGNLDDDAAANPSPTPTPNPPLIPSDRIIAGTVNYPPNQPFWLSFLDITGSADDLATFHFGGAAEVFPTGQSGGRFCLTLKNSGRAFLKEYDAEITEGDPWKPVWEFPWKHAHASSPAGLIETNNLFVVPYARDRIAFYNTGYGFLGAAMDTYGFVGILAQAAIMAISMEEWRQGVPMRLYRHHEKGLDHRHLKSMTGTGQIKLDRPRTERLPFHLYAPRYHTTGYVVDAGFVIDSTNNLPLATPITLTVNGYVPRGTSIVPTIYDATTGVALLRTGPFWLTNEGQRSYYVGFELRSDGDPDAAPPVAEGEQTPALFSYTVIVPPGFETVGLTPFKTIRLRGVYVNGPGVTPAEENASCQIEDEIDEIALLRVRDQMASKLVLLNRNTGVPLSVLFEGQTASPDAQLKGIRIPEAYPSLDWTAYNTRLTGRWPRIYRQFHASAPFVFASSENSAHPLASTEFDSGFAPWCITDMMRFGFANAGVPDSQLDIRHLSLRLPADKSLGQDDYAIWPGVQYAKWIESLAADFLGMLIVRDPNAGTVDSSGLPRGMWRLLPNPDPASTNYLFVIDIDNLIPPPAPGQVNILMSEGMLGAGVYPCISGTWKTKPIAPEGNIVISRAPAAGGTDGGAQLLTSEPLVNLASFDPTSPHYLEGEIVPIVKVYDSFAATPEALAWANRILYQRAAFAEKWFEAVIPLPLLVDAADPLQVLPRPPRINDLCLVKRKGVYYDAIVRSCNPAYSHDDWQLCHIEGKFRNPAAEV